MQPSSAVAERVFLVVFLVIFFTFIDSQQRKTTLKHLATIIITIENEFYHSVNGYDEHKGFNILA